MNPSRNPTLWDVVSDLGKVAVIYLFSLCSLPSPAIALFALCVRIYNVSANLTLAGSVFIGFIYPCVLLGLGISRKFVRYFIAKWGFGNE